MRLQNPFIFMVRVGGKIPSVRGNALLFHKLFGLFRLFWSAQRKRSFARTTENTFGDNEIGELESGA